MVIELVMEMRKEEELALSTGFIFNRKEGKREGGHPFHSRDQQILAEEVADVEYVWLVGRSKAN